MRLRNAGNQGVVYVEFLIVIVPLLILVMSLIQLGLIYGAELLVETSAHLAVRSAVVILPDDKADYAGVGVNQIGTGHGLEAYRKAPRGSRIDLIRRAAAVPLLSLGLGAGAVARFAIGQSTLSDALKPGGIAAALSAQALGLVPVAVTLPDGKGRYRTSVGETERITARVTFLFPCLVPIASSVVCSTFSGLPSDRRAELETAGRIVDLAKASAGRFVALVAERSMVNQGRER